MIPFTRRLADDLVQSRAGGRVERCHGIPHQGSYSNAAHSWGVAMLMYYLWPEDYPRLSIYCLTHDVPEAWVGDIPAPTCRYLPGLMEALHKVEAKISQAISLPAESDLDREDLLKLKACDRLEFYLWSREQLSLGNGFAQEGLNEIRHFFDEVALPQRAMALYNELESREVLPRQSRVMRDACRES